MPSRSEFAETERTRFETIFGAMWSRMLYAFGMLYTILCLNKMPLENEFSEYRFVDIVTFYVGGDEGKTGGTSGGYKRGGRR